MPGLIPFSIQSGGVTRTGQIHVPSQWQQGGPALPCIFGFHGKGGSGQNFAQYWTQHQDKNKFAVFLDGLPGILDPDPVWRTLAGMWPDPLQDEVFVLDVIAYMVSTYGIDTSKVYAGGFSSGGHMCQHLHLRCSGSFAGFAYIASSVPMSNNFHLLPAPTTPRPTISAVGEQDPNQWPGDADTMSAIASRDHWRGTWMGLDSGIDAGPTSVPAPGCTNTVWTRYTTPPGHGVFMWARLKQVTCPALHRVFTKAVGDDINATDEAITFWVNFAGLPPFP